MTGFTATKATMQSLDKVGHKKLMLSEAQVMITFEVAIIQTIQTSGVVMATILSAKALSTFQWP